MRRLDGVSTYLLLGAKPGVYQHTLKIGIFDTSQVPGGWSFEEFRDMLRHGTIAHPILRCKVVRVPFGLHHPVWVDDPEFSLDYHLRYVGCPPPGDNRALCALISQIYAYPLDLSKPLWQAWVIDGLADGQIAIVTLLHHAYVDGTGAARLMERYFTAEPRDMIPKQGEWHPEKMPSKPALVLGALRDIPRSLINSLPRVVHGLREVRRVRLQYEKAGEEPAPNPFRDSRDSPFNKLLGPERTFVFETFPFDHIRATAKRFGVTINDLFLAIAAAVYREFMLERGYDVDKGPLLATIPMERRPPVEEDDLVGNKVSGDWLWLPIHIADPLERLRYAHASSMAMKKHFKAIEGADRLSIMEIQPLPLLLLPEWIVRHSKRVIGQSANAVLSNVQGPTAPLYLGRMKLTNWVSIGQTVQGVAINLTVWSYAGKFNLCIMADKDLLPDGWQMIDRFKSALTVYEELSKLDNVHVMSS